MSQTPPLELRDYFAAKAMAAIISKFPLHEKPMSTDVPASIARGAYDYADAMLAIRNCPIEKTS